LLAKFSIISPLCFIITWRLFMEENLKNNYLCPLCGRELTDEQRTHNGWLSRCGEFIPEGTAINSFTGSSDRLTGEHHKRIGGGRS
jgi:hypothetical protein